MEPREFTVFGTVMSGQFYFIEEEIFKHLSVCIITSYYEISHYLQFMMYKSVCPCPCFACIVHLRLICYLHIMSQEAAVHIGPEINCDEVEVVKNEINFICCKISKRVNCKLN